MINNNIVEWDKLTIVDQRPFLERASYIVERGYSHLSVEALAAQIYISTSK
jgi:hypothetical protein